MHKCFVQYLLVPFILLVINVISFKIQTKGIKSINFAQVYKSTCTASKIEIKSVLPFYGYIFALHRPCIIL